MKIVHISCFVTKRNFSYVANQIMEYGQFWHFWSREVITEEVLCQKSGDFVHKRQVFALPLSDQLPVITDDQ